MAVDPEVLRFLKCLSCGTSLTLTADGKGLYCGTCRSVVPITEEILTPAKKSLFQWVRDLWPWPQRPAKERATRDSSPTTPMPELRSHLQVDRTFSPREYREIKLGIVPRDMDDKWFIFLEEDWLHIHRSWTGHCIYQVRLAPAGRNYRIAEVLVNRDRQQYRSDDEYDSRFLLWLIDCIMLDKDAKMPMPPDWET